MKRSSLSDQHCPVARAAAQCVDAWTFVILREIFLGNRRFDGMRSLSGMSPRSLSLRLDQLVENGILERTPYQQAPVRYEYRATPKGLELWPVLILLKQWGDDWMGPWEGGESPVQLTHKGTDHALRMHLVCETCGEPVGPRESHAHVGPHAARERQINRAR